MGYAELRRDLAERVIRMSVDRVKEPAERTPTYERQTQLPAVFQRMFRIGVRWRELVLYGDQPVAKNPPRDIDLFAVHARNAGIPDDAGIQQITQGADLIGIWHCRIRAVRVQQVKRVHTEVPR